MIKALIYKEWLKTKWFLIAIFTANILLLIYNFFSTAHIFRLAGVHHVWDLIVNRYQFLFSNLKYLPLLSAIVLALAQYLPEISKKRLKLSLHLPIKQSSAIFSMLFFGILSLLLCFAFQWGVLWIYAQKYFPSEIITSIFLTLLPWYVAAISAYFLVSFISFEPTWKNRIFYFLFSLALLKIFLISSFPEAYSKIWYFIIALSLILIFLPLLSVRRFKEGVQDRF